MKDNPGDTDDLADMAEDYSGDFEDYYPESARGEIDLEEIPQEDLAFARNVIWVGENGRMLKVEADEAQHIDGNIFDWEKLAAVRDGIQESEDRVVMYAPYGTATVVGLQDIKESIEYAEDEGDSRMMSLGDEDLDAYLVDPEDYIANNVSWDAEEEDIAELRAEMDEQLRLAVEDQDGDLGAIIYQIRDGNHRAFGALISGEPYVYIMLGNNEMQDLELARKKGNMTEEQKVIWELLE
jgi:hypothetical protein